jgi:8-oxo-dGTP pyrophosphatase MutT (NUDIX family)
MIKLCIKCGGEGHTNRSCKEPVTSFGLVVFTRGRPGFQKGRIYSHKHTECPYHEKDHQVFECRESCCGEILFLLVERKDTVGFLNLVQGSYPEMEPYKSKKITRYLSELTCEERNALTRWEFEDLWKIAGSDKKDMTKAMAKFKNLDVNNLISNSTCCYREADYLMPKGRLKFAESTRQCAIREFAEETGYNRNDVHLLSIPPYIEEFTGTDGKMYRNVFYVAQLRNHARIHTKLGDDPHQSKEVRNLGWFNIDECLELMRDYHQDKKDILTNVHDRIKNHVSSCVVASYYGSNPSPHRWNCNWRPNTCRSVRDVALVELS